VLAVSGTLALKERVCPTTGSTAVITTLVTFAAETVTGSIIDSIHTISNAEIFFIMFIMKPPVIYCKDY